MGGMVSGWDLSRSKYSQSSTLVLGDLGGARSTYGGRRGGRAKRDESQPTNARPLLYPPKELTWIVSSCLFTKADLSTLSPVVLETRTSSLPAR